MGDIQKVVLAGATGNLGAPLLQALLDANFEVTVLTRPSSNHTFPSSVKVQQVDYDNVEELTKVFRNQDAFVSTVGSGAIKQQEGMVDAAIAAEVKRLIPSEFGSDITNPNVKGFPVFAKKQELLEYIERATQGTNTTWTAIRNGPFLDFCVDIGLLIDIKNKRIKLYDGGDVFFTTTLIPTAAKGLIETLRHSNETGNRAVQIRGAFITQNQLLRLAQKYTGEDGWQVTHASTEELEKEGWGKLRENPNNPPTSVFLDFLARAVFGRGRGGDFGSVNDNEMLGIQEMTQDEVEAFVKSRAAK